MIATYEAWNKQLKLFEDFGTGVENFSERLELHKGARNLTLSHFKDSWGELDEAEGTLKYRAVLDVSKNGIESVDFQLTSLSLEITTFDTSNEEKSEYIQYELEISEQMIAQDNVEYEIHNLPYYLEEIELDFEDVENLKDKEQLKKIKYSFVIGSKK